MIDTAAPPTGALADLILARLLPAKSSVPPAKLRADVSALFKRPPSGEAFDAAVADLRAAGLISTRGQSLTASGRTRALEYLGVADLPPRAKWDTVVSKVLVPRALGLSPTSAGDAKVLSDGNKLAAELLKRKFGLPADTLGTVNGVLNALVCRAAGLPHVTIRDFRQLKKHLLGKAFGSDDPVDPAAAVPAALDIPSAKARSVRAKVLIDWLEAGTPVVAPAAQPEPIDAADEPFDLESFANTVRAAARTCPTGRFGTNKVFISHVWRQLEHDRPFAALGADGFKARLVEAHRVGLLELARADLVQGMDPADVHESEATYLNATFHFIVTAGN